jgi:hypothetical protein
MKLHLFVMRNTHKAIFFLTSHYCFTKFLEVSLNDI